MKDRNKTYLCPKCGGAIISAPVFDVIADKITYYAKCENHCCESMIKDEDRQSAILKCIAYIIWIKKYYDAMA